MTDVVERHLRGFAERAEPLVAVPVLDELRERGAVRRRRRSAAVGAAVVVGALVVGGVAASVVGSPRVEEPVGPLRVEASPWPGGPRVPRLEAGTYELRLSPYADVPTARITVPDGWRGYLGPFKETRDGSLSVLVSDVDQVVETPCEAMDNGMVDVSDDPAALTEALQRLPGHRVVQAPAADDRFGWPATHLTLRTTRAVDCPWREPFFVLDTANGLLDAPPPGVTLDIWVVDLDGRAVLVNTTTPPGATRVQRAELSEVLASVEIDQPASP